MTTAKDIKPVRIVDPDAAKATYEASIAMFDGVLALNPDDPEALINKGISIQNLAKLQAEMGDFEAAMADYENAIATFETALTLNPNKVAALNGKGLSLQGLADLQANLQKERFKSQSADARERYTKLCQSGFIGSGHGSADLSATYKARWFEDLKKHDHR